VKLHLVLFWFWIWICIWATPVPVPVPDPAPTVDYWVALSHLPRHRSQVRPSSCSPSSTSCVDSGTRSWSVARSNTEHARSQCVVGASSNGWNGTPSPAPASDSVCRSGGHVCALLVPRWSKVPPKITKNKWERREKFTIKITDNNKYIYIYIKQNNTNAKQQQKQQQLQLQCIQQQEAQHIIV